MSAINYSDTREPAGECSRANGTSSLCVTCLQFGWVQVAKVGFISHYLSAVSFLQPVHHQVRSRMNGSGTNGIIVCPSSYSTILKVLGSDELPNPASSECI